jgi:hypothetical protein
LKDSWFIFAFSKLLPQARMSRLLVHPYEQILTRAREVVLISSYFILWPTGKEKNTFICGYGFFKHKFSF